ncbi:hypothetical protein B0J12DRAFT_704017 [Macrophomina phaseolina]|uniref:Uncharacterized protein n=1 Tax=Macrophomina phaseolina TaxID=35725 RepID=A0ABQ8FZI9_9PEZI|nr:hypothetical protein B0J12DRAFT_704017 [Macrophomina phaseolina]
MTSITRATNPSAHAMSPYSSSTNSQHLHRQHRRSSPPNWRISPLPSPTPFTTLEAALRSVSLSPETDDPPSPYYDRSPPEKSRSRATKDAAPLPPLSSSRGSPSSSNYSPATTSSSSSSSSSLLSLSLSPVSTAPTEAGPHPAGKTTTPTATTARKGSMADRGLSFHLPLLPTPPPASSSSSSSSASHPHSTSRSITGRLRHSYTWPLSPGDIEDNEDSGSDARGAFFTMRWLASSSSRSSSSSSSSPGTRQLGCDEDGSEGSVDTVVRRGLAGEDGASDAEAVQAALRRELPPGIEEARGFWDFGGDGDVLRGRRMWRARSEEAAAATEEEEEEEEKKGEKEIEPPGAAVMMIRASERRRSESGAALRGYRMQCAECGRCKPERSRFCCSWPPVRMMLFGAGGRRKW